MTRKALIISNPGEIGSENYCEGVNKDVDNYKNFLMSPQGGYWYENEIVCLNKPSSNLLEIHFNSLKNIDYSIIVFCGHGYSCKDETIIELNKDCNIYARSLKKGAKKRTIILDCCRKNAESINESLIHEFSSLIEKRAINGIEARKYYEALLTACPDETVVAYACDLNETAGDDSRKGGYYSYSLLQCARKWAAQPTFSKSFQSIVSIHNQACVATMEKSNNNQNPQIDKPRSTPYFPFVVRL